MNRRRLIHEAWLLVLGLALVLAGCASTGTERRPTTTDDTFSPFEWSPETSDTIEPPFDHLPRQR